MATPAAAPVTSLKRLEDCTEYLGVLSITFEEDERGNTFCEYSIR